MKGVTSVYRIVNNNGNPKIQYNNINTSSWVDFAEVGGGRANYVDMAEELNKLNSTGSSTMFIKK